MKAPNVPGLILLLLFTIGHAESPLRANPADGVVTFGGAEISGGAGNLTILQTTDKAIINWGDFSIRRGEITQFIQPGSRSAVLNRVVSGNPSALDGALRANGTVLLINPNGILVGPSGTIDVGGSLTLSTLDISDDNFLAGGDLIFSRTTDAGVVNMGRINAIEGDVFLFGQTVSNQGTITAPNGTVGLGAGSEVLLTANPDRNGERVYVRAGAGARSSTGVENAGTIEAAAVELKAHGNLYALAINNSGSIRATGASRRGGGVFLRSPGGRIENTGTVEATVPGSRGGRILVEANTFDLGGTLKTDPEGDIDLLVNQVNLLPGATIGDQPLGELITAMTDSESQLVRHAVERANAAQLAGAGPSGRIIRSGRFASGPAPVVSKSKDGRVRIGMPGIRRIQPGLTPRTVSTAPSTAIIRESAVPEERPAVIQPDGRPAVPGSSIPPGPDGKPQVPPIDPRIRPGTGNPRP